MMAYLPSPIKHDLFLSYAHEDVAWVRALRKKLKERLLDSLGECEIWQDNNEIATGQNWPEALKNAIRASAAFIAVVSRNYQNSKDCADELRIFLNEAEKQNRLETGGYGRVLKVIKFPWLYDAHKGFLSDYQHIDFFDRSPETREVRHFKPTSETFRKAVNKLSADIETLFGAMLRGMVKVFVARASATTISDKRESIIRDLRASGFALSPPPVGALPDELATKSFQPFIGESDVSVHLLGAEGDRDTREQIDLAREAGKKTIFCLLPGHESAQGEHKALLKEIRENKWDLAAGTWKLIERVSIESLKQDLNELLDPSKPARTDERDDASRVYLLCDPTSAEDAAFASEVQMEIQSKERFQVKLPPAASDSSSPGAQHERLLRWCDGLLLYCDKAPPNWYLRNFNDLLTADDLADRRQLRSKALLAAGRDVEITGLTVIQRRDPFDLGQLEPFLAPLRQPSSGQGGAAHVGG